MLEFIMRTLFSAIRRQKGVSVSYQSWLFYCRRIILINPVSLFISLAPISLNKPFINRNSNINYCETLCLRTDIYVVNWIHTSCHKKRSALYDNLNKKHIFIYSSLHVSSRTAVIYCAIFYILK